MLNSLTLRAFCSGQGNCKIQGHGYPQAVHPGKKKTVLLLTVANIYSFQATVQVVNPQISAKITLCRKYKAILKLCALSTFDEGKVTVEESRDFS
jgi:hypothetical protein